MAEYISKDDASALMALLDEKVYNLSDARSMLNLRDRLKRYIDNPEGEYIKMIENNTAVLVVEEKEKEVAEQVV